MSDDQKPPRTPGIGIAVWVGLGAVLVAAAVFGTSRRRTGAPSDGVPEPDMIPDMIPDVTPDVVPAVTVDDVEEGVLEEPIAEDSAPADYVIEGWVTENELPDEAPEGPVTVHRAADEAPDWPSDAPAVVAAPKPSRKGKRRRSTGGRIAFWIGIAMILAGLGLLGYVAWQLWGTNWASHRYQREITQELQQEWEQGSVGCTENCPTGKATALIRIPKFGRDYVVPVLEGVTPNVLEKGFGHFKESADPGEVGNYALAGHRVTHGEPLRKMPQLRPGDKVIVETRDTTYTYVLDTNPNELVVPFTGVWVVDPLPKNPRAGGPQPAQRPDQRLITLTTCSEIFHTDNRMISFGHLLTAVPKTESVEG